MKTCSLFIFLIILLGCSKSDDPPEYATEFRLIGSCDDIGPVLYVPNGNSSDYRNEDVGDIYLEFFEDSTYAIRYNLKVYQSMFEPAKTYIKDETGDFTYTQPIVSANNKQSGYGRIFFQPTKTESWTAIYNIGLGFGMSFRLGNGSIIFKYSGCYEYK